MALSLLLPTQAELLQRLQHLACFGQQSTVILGQPGAGKSTLLTSLASEQDGCNAALLVCPMHADAAELRRKILIQLLSDPLFDDEVPLMETIGRLCLAEKKPIHIFIDDAQYLPKELWVECLLLPRLTCGGRPICVTMTADAAAGRELYRQLGNSQRELMLPIEIAPLPQSEREALYYSLISRSDDVPYVPRDIVKAQLEAQSGKPAEVIALLEKALVPEPPAPSNGMPRWVFAAAGISLLVTLAVTVSLWSLWQSHPGANESLQAREQSPVNEASLLRPFAAWRLEAYFVARQAALERAQIGLDTAQPKPTAALDERSALSGVAQGDVMPDAISVTMTAAENASEAKALIEARELAQVSTADMVIPGSGNEVQPAQKLDKHNNDKSRGVAGGSGAGASKPTLAKVDGPEAAKLWDEKDLLQGTRPGAGYTLQLATVSKRGSADGLLKQLAGEKGLRLAAHKGKLVVLLGDFPARADAIAEAERISARYGTGKPWVRAWKDLTALKMLADTSGGEISN